jgi:two-component system, response regulator
MSSEPVDILLVEDNPNDAELALYALEKHKLANRIEIVRDGAEAIDYLFRTGAYTPRKAERLPHLILLDLKRPKLDGIEVLKEIKSDERTKAIPVVMLTTSREESDIVESYRLGVNSYIVKPADFSQFTKAIEQIGFYWLVLNERSTASGA